MTFLTSQIFQISKQDQARKVNRSEQQYANVTDTCHLSLNDKICVGQKSGNVPMFSKHNQLSPL